MYRLFGLVLVASSIIVAMINGCKPASMPLSLDIAKEDTLISAMKHVDVHLEVHAAFFSHVYYNPNPPVDSSWEGRFIGGDFQSPTPVLMKWDRYDFSREYLPGGSPSVSYSIYGRISPDKKTIIFLTWLFSSASGMNQKSSASASFDLDNIPLKMSRRFDTLYCRLSGMELDNIVRNCSSGSSWFSSTIGSSTAGLTSWNIDEQSVLTVKMYK
jgi:hypothetical protein